MTNRIRDLRTQRDLSQEGLADLVGTTKAQISKLEKGQRRLTDDWMRRLAPALGVAPADLMLERGDRPTVPLVGYVGAGAEVQMFDGDQGGDRLDDVEAPPDADAHTVAVVVRGPSMDPVFRDRDLIYYRNVRGQPGDLIGRECVVGLADGHVYVKILQRGNTAGLFNLFSYNAPLISDVVVEWAVKVAWVKRD